MSFSKKAQEEITGFVVIVLIVAVIAVIFLLLFFIFSFFPNSEWDLYRTIEESFKNKGFNETF